MSESRTVLDSSVAREGMKDLHVDMEPELHEALKAWCKSKGVSRTGLMRALAEALAEEPDMKSVPLAALIERGRELAD